MTTKKEFKQLIYHQCGKEFEGIDDELCIDYTWKGLEKMKRKGR